MLEPTVTARSSLPFGVLSFDSMSACTASRGDGDIQWCAKTQPCGKCRGRAEGCFGFGLILWGRRGRRAFFLGTHVLRNKHDRKKGFKVSDKGKREYASSRQGRSALQRCVDDACEDGTYIRHSWTHKSLRMFSSAIAISVVY